MKANSGQKICASDLSYTEREIDLEQLGECNEHFVGIPLPLKGLKSYDEIRKSIYKGATQRKKE